MNTLGTGMQTIIFNITLCLNLITWIIFAIHVLLIDSLKFNQSSTFLWFYSWNQGKQLGMQKSIKDSEICSWFFSKNWKCWRKGKNFKSVLFLNKRNFNKMSVWRWKSTNFTLTFLKSQKDPLDVFG